MALGLLLILPGMTGEGSPKLPDLPFGSRVPATQGLCRHGEEGDPLSPTLLLCPPNLPVVGEGEGVARGGSSTNNSGCL